MAKKKNGSTITHTIDKGLHLIRQVVGSGAKAKPAPSKVHHIACIDCSGSMSGDLPKIREQLKKKLPMLMKEGDVMSLVWFSGRKECGTLLEAEPIAGLADLKAVNDAIDRWLKPVGLTGFKEPLELVADLADKVAKKLPGTQPALFFMSDGCDNQWSRQDIIKAVEQAAGKVASSTFVEYGYYADRQLLAAMAAKSGGNHIFAEDFDKYAPAFEKTVTTPLMGGPRVDVKLEGDPILGIAWALTPDGDVLTFDATGGHVAIPENLGEIAYLSPSKAGSQGDDVADVAEAVASGRRVGTMALDHTYAALSVVAVRMKPEIMLPMLKAVGDVAFIDAFSRCFGKQKYSEFVDAAKTAAFEAPKRFETGRDPNAVPADDAFTMLDLLSIMTSDDRCRLLLDHPEFSYSRISRARVDASDGQLTFVADDAPTGYPISSLTYNEDRPNISVLIQKSGTIDLAKIAPADVLAKIPNPFPTNIWRNYALVKDGLVNVDKLPVILSKSTYEVLVKLGVQFTNNDGNWKDKTTIQAVINLRPLPIINRKMVQTASARSLFELEYELVRHRAYQKVFNHYRKTMFPKESEGYAKVYGDDVAKWLKEQGITDYSGYNPPKTTQVAATDFYLGKEMTVSLKGYASLPKVDDVKSKMKSGKLNGAARFMADAINEAETFFAKNPAKLHEQWLTAKADVMTATTRGLIYNAAKIKFAVIVGQTWFQEWTSLDQNTATVKMFDGTQVDGEIELREVEIKI